MFFITEHGIINIKIFEKIEFENLSFIRFLNSIFQISKDLNKIFILTSARCLELESFINKRNLKNITFIFNEYFNLYTDINIIATIMH